jgi:hypothetical protein
MIEMEYGDTVIKVMAQKVEEMKRKGWKVKGEIEPVEVEVLTDENLEAESDGDTYGN